MAANQDETQATYNGAAKELAAYFRGIGSRNKDIQKALELAGKADGTADVLEIGCGDGRDAQEIVKRVRSYKGIDYSTELIKLARDLLPDADFEVQDMLDFVYPKNTYDIVFAFASLLHVDRDSLQETIHKVSDTLKEQGIFYISLKYAPHVP